jgi:PPOX class probable F420-dependent enzyme
MNLSPDQARTRLADSPVAVLGTVTPDGRPHLVPVTYIVLGDTVYTAIDAKPKRSGQLKRLSNIAADPRVCLLAEHYDADWSQLWWARADGDARVVDFTQGPPGLLSALCERYPWYAQHPPAGALIEVTVSAWTGWAFESR